jgi:hypothetical protein
MSKSELDNRTVPVSHPIASSASETAFARFVRMAVRLFCRALFMASCACPPAPEFKPPAAAYSLNAARFCADVAAAAFACAV